MSHEIDMSNGRANMAFIGEKPWHGLGDELEAGAPLEQWRIAAGLNWEAKRGPALFIPEKVTENGDIMAHQFEKVPDREVLYRSDTCAPLGIVSPNYKIVQPEEVMEFYRDLTEEHGFELETAGSLYGGKKIWALANTKNAVEIAKNDTLKSYVLLATSFDGSMATTAKHTSIRVVCNNTLSVATMDRNANHATFSHRGKFDANTTKALLGLGENWAEFTDDIAKLVKFKISKAQATQYFLDLFYPDTDKVDMSDGKAMQSVNKALNAYAIQPGPSDTLWGALNAVTYMVDHNGRTRSDDSRLQSAWFGAGESLKNRAFKLAVEKAA